jgi:outer membrane protein assembly factor BamB
MEAESGGVLYVGTQRYVAAIDVQTGLELWRTKLPKGSGIVCVIFAAGSVFASVSGHVYRLSPTDGRVLWHNQLPGMGFGLVTMGIEGLDTQQAAMHSQLQAEAAQRAAASS